MKLLELTKNKFARVDDEDYYWVSQFNWFAVEIKGEWYACRSARKNHIRSREQYEVYLHRVVTKTQDPTLVIDHRDHDGLNCQKYNLRICSKTENNRHTTSHKDSSSKYLGVSWDKNRSKWMAALTHNKEKVLNKRFESEVDAARAYDQAAKAYHGEFANLNFKE